MMDENKCKQCLLVCPNNHLISIILYVKIIRPYTKHHHPGWFFGTFIKYMWRMDNLIDKELSISSRKSYGTPLQKAYFGVLTCEATDDAEDVFSERE